MTSFALRRAGQLILVLLGVSLIAFVLLDLSPGDAARIKLGERANDPEALARLRESLDLDGPVATRYLRFMGRALQGDLGTSYRRGEPVLEEVAQVFPATVELALAAMVIATAIGVPAGILAAVRAGGLVDLAVMGVSLVGVSLPVFWLGYILILGFGGTLPFAGRLDDHLAAELSTGFYALESLLGGRLDTFGDAVRHLALPAVALSTIPMAVIARLTRASVLDVLSEDYVRTARAKGLAPWAVVLRHVLPNALVPVVTVLGLQLGYLLGGAVLTETVFSWPGVGTYAVTAITSDDEPAIRAVVLLGATAFVLLNFVVDMAYAALDPRIRDAR